MHCYKKLLIFFSIIFLGPSASTTTTTTTLPSGNVFWRYSQKKFWKKLKLDWPHYTTPERSKKNIKQEKFVKMQQKLFPLQIIKMVSTLCLPLPYYLWKGVACNQLHIVSFDEFLSGFIVNSLHGVIIIKKCLYFTRNY